MHITHFYTRYAFSFLNMVDMWCNTKEEQDRRSSSSSPIHHHRKSKRLLHKGYEFNRKLLLLISSIHPFLFLNLIIYKILFLIEGFKWNTPRLQKPYSYHIKRLLNRQTHTLNVIFYTFSLCSLRIFSLSLSACSSRIPHKIRFSNEDSSAMQSWDEPWDLSLSKHFLHFLLLTFWVSWFFLFFRYFFFTRFPFISTWVFSTEKYYLSHSTSYPSSHLRSIFYFMYTRTMYSQVKM